MALNRYEITYQLPDIKVGYEVHTNAGLQEVNHMIMDELYDAKTDGSFVTINDPSSGMITNIKAVRVITVVVREIKPSTQGNPDDDTEMDEVDYE